MNTPASAFETAQKITHAYDDYLRQLQALPHTKALDEPTQAMLYANACNLMQVGRFDNAAKYFRFLIFYVPQNVDYLQGLATCTRTLGDWPATAQALGTALYLTPDSCSLAVSWAEALLHLGMQQVAQIVLQTVIRLASSTEDAPLKQRAQLLLQATREAAPSDATA